MASGNQLAELLPLSNQFPAANGAEFDTRNDHPLLDFDADADQDALFTRVLAQLYSGLGFTLDVVFAMSSATTGNVVLMAAIERFDPTHNLDTDSFAVVQSATVAVPGTNGQEAKASIVFTNAQIDGLLKGETYRLKLSRDANNVSDTAAGDLEFVSAELRET